MTSLQPCTQYFTQQDVIEISPDEHYGIREWNGTLCNVQLAISQENVLRINFLGLFFVKLFLFSPVQIVYRLYDLGTGGFFFRGTAIAEHEHLRLRESVVPIHDIAYHVLLELIKDISRIVLYPLYFIAMECSAFIGWFDPVFGMRLVSRLDQLEYVHPLQPYAPANPLEEYGNLAAPSVQSTQFCEENNIYRYAPDYDPDSQYTSYLRLTHLVKKASDCFSRLELQAIYDAMGMVYNGEAKMPENPAIHTTIRHINDAMGQWCHNDDGYTATLRSVELLA